MFESGNHLYDFTRVTDEEIKKRRKMYEEAASLGIDLMGFDDVNHSSVRRRDRRKAVVLFGTGQSVSKELKERLTKNNVGKRTREGRHK